MVAWLIMMLPSMGIQMMLLGPVATFDPAAGANMTATMLALQGLGNFLATILTAPFLVACLVTLYFDRRVSAEGLDLQRAVEAMERPGEPYDR